MEQTLTLTPEQLFILGTLMNAQYINYDYIACMGELQRNYSRIYRKCMDELVQMGILRQRLSGEISLRPAIKKMLKNLFFGKEEASLEILKLGKHTEERVFRFHYLDNSVTQVEISGNKLLIREGSEQEIETLVQKWINGTELPENVNTFDKEALTAVFVAKKATVDVGSSGIVLFETPGGFYTMDDNGSVTGVPSTRARAIILSKLKGA